MRTDLEPVYLPAAHVVIHGPAEHVHSVLDDSRRVEQTPGRNLRTQRQTCFQRPVKRFQSPPPPVVMVNWIAVLAMVSDCKGALQALLSLLQFVA